MSSRTLNRSKSKKVMKTTLGTAPAPPNSEERLDFSHIRQPISTSIFGLKDVLTLFETATDEVRKYVAYECDIMYECRICRTIFRSLANFILHKRKYCTDNYHSTHILSNLSSKANNIHNEPNVNDETLKSRSSPEKEPKKDITVIFDKLIITQEDEETQFSLENASEADQCANVNITIEQVEGNKSGVFQTLSKQVNNNQIDFMKSEVMEIHGIFEKNEAILGSDGKIVQFDNGMKNERTKAANVLVCTLCNLKFATKKTLTYHQKYKHNETRLVYPCPECKDTFANVWCVFRHLYKIHRKSTAQIRKLRSQIHNSSIKQKAIEKKDTNVEEPTADQNCEDQVNQQWLASFEDDNDLQMCGGCGKHFERKAALHSHFQMCMKRQAVYQSLKEKAIRKSQPGENTTKAGIKAVKSPSITKKITSRRKRKDAKTIKKYVMETVSEILEDHDNLDILNDKVNLYNKDCKERTDVNTKDETIDNGNEYLKTNDGSNCNENVCSVMNSNNEMIDNSKDSIGVQESELLSPTVDSAIEIQTPQTSDLNKDMLGHRIEPLQTEQTNLIEDIIGVKRNLNIRIKNLDKLRSLESINSEDNNEMPILTKEILNEPSAENCFNNLQITDNATDVHVHNETNCEILEGGNDSESQEITMQEEIVYGIDSNVVSLTNFHESMGYSSYDTMPDIGSTATSYEPLQNKIAILLEDNNSMIYPVELCKESIITTDQYECVSFETSSREAFEQTALNTSNNVILECHEYPIDIDIKEENIINITLEDVKLEDNLKENILMEGYDFRRNINDESTSNKELIEYDGETVLPPLDENIDINQIENWEFKSDSTENDQNFNGIDNFSFKNSFPAKLNSEANDDTISVEDNLYLETCVNSEVPEQLRKSQPQREQNSPSITDEPEHGNANGTLQIFKNGIVAQIKHIVTDTLECNTINDNQKNSLRKKAAPYIDEKKLLCTPCQSTFLSLNLLLMHMSAHFNWNHFQCTKCTFMSYTKSKAAAHVNANHRASSIDRVENLILPIPMWKTIILSSEFIPIYVTESIDKDSVNSVEARPSTSNMNKQQFEKENVDEETSKLDTMDKYDPSVRKMILEVIFGNENLSKGAEVDAQKKTPEKNRPIRTRTKSYKVLQKDFIYGSEGANRKLKKNDVLETGSDVHIQLKHTLPRSSLKVYGKKRKLN